MENLLVWPSAEGRDAQATPSFPERKKILGQNSGSWWFCGVFLFRWRYSEGAFLWVASPKKQSYANILPSNSKRNVISKNLQVSLYLSSHVSLPRRWHCICCLVCFVIFHLYLCFSPLTRRENLLAPRQVLLPSSTPGVLNCTEGFIPEAMPNSGQKPVI